MLTFEDFTSRVDHDNPRWAASDRGWLYDTSKTRWDGGRWGIGHYLSYGVVPGIRQAPMVHAVVFDRRENPCTGMDDTCNIRAKEWPTVDAARAWMLEALTGQCPLL